MGIMQTVYCFRCHVSDHGGTTAECVRPVLARMLVHYHPLAGRLDVKPEMKLASWTAPARDLFLEVGELSTLDTDLLGNPNVWMIWEIWFQDALVDGSRLF